MSVDDLLTTAKHAEKALQTMATELRGTAEKVANLQTTEHSARALRKLAKELDEVGLPHGKLVRDVAGAIERLAVDLGGLERMASLLDVTAKQLKRTSKTALSAPPDETPPDGLYLDRLQAALGTEYEWITPALSRWLVAHTRKLRSMVRKLLGPAEIAGDAQIVAEAQALLDEVNKGPSLEHGR